jgi:hypothetical protein
MHGSTKVWPAAAAAVMVLLLTGCGTQPAPESPSASQSSGHASEGLCPQAVAPAAASPCVSAGVQQYQQSNQGFNARLPVPGWLAARARPETRRVREALERLTPAQRLRAAAVQSALLAAGLWREGLVVLAGPPYTSVVFGGYEPFNTRPAVCVWGILTPKSVTVDVGGNTREGACLPGAGGH